MASSVLDVARHLTEMALNRILQQRCLCYVSRLRGGQLVRGVPHLRDLTTSRSKADRLLVLNAGSSSLKFKLYSVDQDEQLKTKFSGVAERIGGQNSVIKRKDASGLQETSEMVFKSHRDALQGIFDSIGILPESLIAVGHRVTHGKDKLVAATKITPQVKQIIMDTAPLAPLHNPVNLMGIDSAEALLGDKVPQIAVFDTAFHQRMPSEAFHYAIGAEVYEKYGIRRYGYHGSSYAYLLSRVNKLLQKDRRRINTIMCHLGAGASIACVKNGVCVDTSMGMTPLEGLVMGTRCGDIDPGAVLHLAKQIGIEAADKLLNKKSGLLGISGVDDMRDVLQRAHSNDPRAKLAFEMWSRRVRKYIGAYSTVLDGNIDCLVFSAGIGENSDVARFGICRGLDFLGIKIDEKANVEASGECTVSTPDSAVKIFVVPTDEELQIALETIAVVSEGQTRKHTTR
eukprot:Plantae.Rhodophyta-Purpureofilum_apyrenoidigerum.ctg14966.p1 GENE.Plantae.Rhodophyta-Purpureofilum_apyrenoidigerum.ctg14966~~Plantae.Rhodophyta-Purpureofilum_apyrenoidigerum.ctg14966.p1  ORF type:complete len:457 (-),score=67.12 Plantae.Rhodophyta-Purpureofilum_apyrenoidigerum.ctg14966:239-1609(-)